VAELVDRELANRPASEEARLRITDGFKLQYYFGGHWIAYLDTPKGKEVLAVEWNEIRRVRRKRRRAGLAPGIIELIDPW
jgi:hypothetical protein